MSLIMNPIFSRAEQVARGARPDAAPTSAPATLGEQLSELYRLAQHSTHVFASPLGLIGSTAEGQSLPRFVYFGPNSSDASVRLAFYAGLDRRDLATTASLLRLVDELVRAPQLGEQLNLSFFPLVDIAPDRIGGLAAESWVGSTAPELQVLAADARQRDYHGFVRLETVSGEDVLGIELRTSGFLEHATPAVELVTDEEITPFPVRWEVARVDERAVGPLALAADFSAQPFELTLRFPKHWSFADQQSATASILTRFVLRYRAFVAYGQHL
jgi:hypothetical protein